jgi:hypothetical protein
VKLSRRRAIQLASMSAFAAAAGSAFAAGGSQSDKVFSDQNLSLYGNLSAATFQPWVDTDFAVSGQKGAKDTMTLKSVSDLTALELATNGATGQTNGSPSPRQVTGFMLKFQGTGAALPQDTYVLSNHALGSFSAFLVPAGSGRPHYTAIFASVPPAA